MPSPNNDGVVLWDDEAACKNANPAIFFGEDIRSKEYRKYCDNCPIKEECLDRAVIYNYSGIWGGTTDRQRQRIPKERVEMLRDDYIESGLYDSKLKCG